MAIVLFYWLLFPWPASAPSFAVSSPVPVRIRAARHPGDDWPEGIDRIMKVRETEIYLLLSMEDIDATSVEAAFMEGRRRRLLAERPISGRPSDLCCSP